MLDETEQYAKLLTRNPNTLKYDKNEANFDKIPMLVQSLIVLRVKESLLEALFTFINWSSIFKEENPIHSGIVTQFFQAITTQQTSKIQDTYLIRVPLNQAKAFVDLASGYMHSQLDRMRR